jgi:hypothetical protein
LTLTALVVFDHLLKMNALPMVISGLNRFDGTQRARWMHDSLRLRGGIDGFVAKDLAVEIELTLSCHGNRKHLL